MEKKSFGNSFYAIIILGVLLLNGCNSQGDKFNFYKNLAKEEMNANSNNLPYKGVFPKSLSISTQEDIDNFFYRIPNNSFIKNGISFDLFLLKSNGKYFPGYWGERENTVFFIPFSKNACEDVFVLYQLNSNGYFNLPKPLCPVYDFDQISDGYSYKVENLGDSLFSITQFSNPKRGIDITEVEYLKTANLLKMVVSKSQGIVEFSYDFSPTDDYILPWLVE